MHLRLPTLAVAALVALAAAAPASAKLARNASDKAVASEFLRILQTKSASALADFLSPSFLLQRPDGTFLTRSQYLKNPSVVESFTVRNVVAKHLGKDIRIIRYTAITNQTIDGQQITNDPVPRLSTYVYSKRYGWQVISHANFSPIPR